MRSKAAEAAHEAAAEQHAEQAGAEEAGKQSAEYPAKHSGAIEETAGRRRLSASDGWQHPAASWCD